MSDEFTVNIASPSQKHTLKVKFDPNATGYRLYARNETELGAGQYFLYYDSTASAELIEAIDLSTGNSRIQLSAEGAAMFPTEGDLLIDGEYMHYTMANTEQQTNASGEKYIEVSVTRGGDTYNGRTNVMASHSKGSQVFMVNDGFLHQDSPTPCLSGLWRFPEYSWSVGEPWYTYIPFVDALNTTRGTYFTDVRPRFDEDMPANYASDYISFRLEMRDKSGATNVPTLDRVPMCGRVMVTVGKEAY